MDNKEVLLTAIIFTYNHKNSVAECIESLLNQKTGYGYEIHIWDDCSTDGTSDICREYAKNYPDKIKLVVQAENTFTKPDLQLQSYQAFQNIKTKYFCVIDGDDKWCNENKIQLAIDFLEEHPDYSGWAHDTLQINQFDNTKESYVHDLLKWNVSNTVAFDTSAPFLLTSSRIFRYAGYEKLRILPIDYLVYYYHLSKGPIYYYDKIMAVYTIGSDNTFANLGRKVRNLNSMFAFRLAKLFNFKQDEFCTEMQKKYDVTNFLGEKRYKRLLKFKKIFGIKAGWYFWFIYTFIPKYGFECMNINYVYSRKKAKKAADPAYRRAKLLKAKNKYLKKLKSQERLVDLIGVSKKVCLSEKLLNYLDCSVSRKMVRIKNIQKQIDSINEMLGGDICKQR